ncbi:MAG: hypothetical protein HFG66_11640 [Hungatella sp.]|jgi:hypothetical protein|nr:hypothetical protein [Hungatella sp.]
MSIIEKEIATKSAFGLSGFSDSHSVFRGLLSIDELPQVHASLAICAVYP